MNIIKLKDVIMPAENDMSEFFNANLKGRYAYWVQLRYVFPFDSVDRKMYVELEQADEEYFKSEECPSHIDLYTKNKCMHDFAVKYIDVAATEQINSISKYVISNKYVTEPDIDISMIKRFRTWLAEELLFIHTNACGNYTDQLSNEQIHMLKYYTNNMYDDVVKYLNIFGYENASMDVSNKTNCGCCSNSTSVYDLSVISACNALNIYVKNIHALMVKTFEEPDFWAELSVEFIKRFKKYIDNIITLGFTVEIETKHTLYNMCKCNEQPSIACNDMLKHLSTALQYIIDDDVKAHKLYIHDSLKNWAEYMYERMHWENSTK